MHRKPSMIAVFTLLGYLCLFPVFVPGVIAQSVIQVPAPQIFVRHNPAGYTGESGYQEGYWLEMMHGGIHYILQADRYTVYERYQQNIQFSLNGKTYMNQFTMSKIKIDYNGTTDVDFVSSAQLIPELGPIAYEGEVPVFAFNLTFAQIPTPTYGQGPSNLTLTMRHVFYPGWSETTIKIEVYLNLENFTLFSPQTHALAPANAPFNVSVIFAMQLTDRTTGTDVGILPTSAVGTTLIYDILDNTGNPMSLASLNMSDAFLDYNGTVYTSKATVTNLTGQQTVGNVPGAGELVEHKYIGLQFQNSSLVYCDPQIWMSHDWVSTWILPVVAISGCASVVVILIVVVVRKRRRHVALNKTPDIC
nr:hypothetical protein [Candidatus Sigynarchaeota archaeon]